MMCLGPRTAHQTLAVFLVTQMPFKQLRGGKGGEIVKLGASWTWQQSWVRSLGSFLNQTRVWAPTSHLRTWLLRSLLAHMVAFFFFFLNLDSGPWEIIQVPSFLELWAIFPFFHWLIYWPINLVTFLKFLIHTHQLFQFFQVPVQKPSHFQEQRKGHRAFHI